MKCYCSLIGCELVKKYFNIDINKACKNHDNNVGMRGTYCPLTPHIIFYKELRDLGASVWLSVVIALGGAVLSWVKQPWLWYKIYKYRRQFHSKLK